MTETDALVREIEDQRNFMATRAARFASAMAAKDTALASAQAEIQVLKDRIAELEAAAPDSTKE